MVSTKEKFLYLTTRIEGKNANGNTSVGTGFFFVEKQQLFVVTNKHVVEGVESGSFLVHHIKEDDPEQKPLKDSLSIFFTKDSFKGHPNPNIDVAVMNITESINTFIEQGYTPLYTEITKELIPDSKNIKEIISPFEEVIFIGYPNGIWDSVNNLPIVRKGITATPYTVDFIGQAQFLIDASVFPGSSGSPVFIYADGTYTKDGKIMYGERVYLIGIIARVYQRLEKGEIVVVDIPTKQTPIAEVRQMIDLGIVFKASTIVETIEYYFEKYQTYTISIEISD